MSWEDLLRQKLTTMRGDGSLADLSAQTGVPVPTLSRILRGDRGIGSSVLEQLRQNCPSLLAEIFLPAESSVGDSIPCGGAE